MAERDQIINGRYKILRLLGKGGMSRVYLAQDQLLGKNWVIKEVQLSPLGGADFAASRILTEADIIKDLDHPGIVRMVDVIRDETAVYIIEDYVAGMTLGEYVRRRGSVNEKEVIRWAMDICGILEYLHSRKPAVIYRDVKPENLILTDSGHIRIVDFGIARRYRPGAERDTVYLGTEQFAAPEQYEDNGRQTDIRTDIYGLGSTLRYLSGFCDHVSPQLKKVIAKCMQPDPDLRYQNAGLLHDELLLTAKAGNRKRGRKLSDIAYLVPLALILVLLLFFLMNRNNRSVSGSVRSWEQVIQMLTDIEEDGMFTKEEEEQLLELLMPNLSEWKEEEGFKEIAFHIGQLYWEYYSYGNDNASGSIEAANWFELSGDYSAYSDIYELIGRFRRDVSRKDTDDLTEGTMKDFFTRITILLTDFSDDSSDACMQLRLFAADTLRVYPEKYLEDGVSLTAMKSLLGQMEESTADDGETDDKSDAETELEKAVESAYAAIKRLEIKETAQAAD